MLTAALVCPRHARLGRPHKSSLIRHKSSVRRSVLRGRITQPCQAQVSMPQHAGQDDSTERLIRLPKSPGRVAFANLPAQCPARSEPRTGQVRVASCCPRARQQPGREGTSSSENSLRAWRQNAFTQQVLFKVYLGVRQKSRLANLLTGRRLPRCPAFSPARRLARS